MPGEPLIIVPASIVKVTPSATYTLLLSIWNLSEVHVSSASITPVCCTGSGVTTNGSAVTSITAVWELDFPCASVTVRVRDAAPASAPAVNVATTLPLVAPASGSDLGAADPPVKVHALDAYPPGDETVKVTSIALLASTDDTPGAVMLGASKTGVTGSGSSHKLWE